MTSNDALFVFELRDQTGGSSGGSATSPPSAPAVNPRTSAREAAVDAVGGPAAVVQASQLAVLEAQVASAQANGDSSQLLAGAAQAAGFAGAGRIGGAFLRARAISGLLSTPAAPAVQAAPAAPAAAGVAQAATPTAGAAAAGAGAGAGASAGGLARFTAPAIAIAALAGTGIAINRAVAGRLGADADRLAAFSPELARAQAQNRVAQTLQNLRLGQQFGANLSEFSRARGQFGRAASELGTDISQLFGPGLSAAIRIGTGLLERLDQLADFALSIDKVMRDIGIKSPAEWMEQVQIFLGIIADQTKRVTHRSTCSIGGSNKS